MVVLVGLPPPVVTLNTFADDNVVALTYVGKFWYVVAEIVLALKPPVKMVAPLTVPPVNGEDVLPVDVISLMFANTNPFDVPDKNLPDKFVIPE